MSALRRSGWIGLLGAGLLACDMDTGPAEPEPMGTLTEPVRDAPLAAAEADPDEPGKKVVQPPLPAEAAPPESKRLKPPPGLERLTRRVPGYFEGHVGRRIYVQVDKPLYKPGETVWVKSWDLRARDLDGENTAPPALYELVDPKGAVVARKRVASPKGRGSNDFELVEGLAGGEYVVRVTAPDGVRGERTVVVSTYEAPRLRKKLEFVRKAYGPGDEVAATIRITRPTGEPLANRPLTALVRLDDVDLPRVALTTNAEGGGVVRFRLPAEIARGDALLTVLADDGGVTESISRRVPILLKKVSLAMFPEGGALVAGLPGRVYFEAKNPLGKPADIEGRVVDDLGNPVATFASHHDGFGRFELKPATGRRYHAEITRPTGVKERFDLPLPATEGCVLRTFDDLDGQEAPLRVAVRCHEDRTVVVAAVQRERLLDAAAVAVREGEPAVVHLKPADEALARAQGIARVTVFTEELVPLAERLVFRNRRAGLRVEVQPEREAYAPREAVALRVATKDAAGRPVPAEIALSVVDDTVVSFADDKFGHLLSRVFLEPELPGKVEEPNFYFDLTEKKSALALELLVGARGWRRFEWAPVLAEPLAEIGGGGLGLRGTGRGGGGKDEGGRVKVAMALEPAPVAAPAPAMAPPAPPPAAEPAEARAAKPAEADKVLPAAPARPAPPPPPAAVVARKPMPDPAAQPAGRAMRLDLADREVAEKKKEDVAFGQRARRLEMAAEEAMPADEIGDALVADAPAPNVHALPIAPVRVFPVPAHAPEYAGPRTDFRETVYWAPAVQTGESGEATVSFPLSDAVTSFRVFAEGVGGGLAGRVEETFRSTLPFSLNVKLPVEVSAGDRMLLPLTLSNERDRELPVSLGATFGDLLKLEKPVKLDRPFLAPGQRASLYYPVTVSGVQGKSRIAFDAEAGGLRDELVREVSIVPLGFPQEHVSSGSLSKQAVIDVDLTGSTPGAVTTAVKLYASPVATMVGGLDGLLRQPSGCFEQTSSTNYPNVMVLQYLDSQGEADPAVVARANGLIEGGYRRLVGFETPKQGYEWFGGAPAHEALTAYGLVQFTDMKRVFPEVDDTMLARTASWLRSRRDGKGGFQRDGKALDSFGRASPEVTDAYIVWALSEAGLAGQFGDEVAAQVRRGDESKDPYLLALAANTMLNLDAHRAAGQKVAARLAGLQRPEGHFTGADHSITRSSGRNLEIETTALALLALMRAEGHADGVRRGVAWLGENRGGYGQWGATQATVLALRAMTEYATRNRRTRGAGKVVVKVNGAPAGEVAYEAGRQEPLELPDFGSRLTPGKNRIELLHDGQDELPYTLAVAYRVERPVTHPEVAVEVGTRLERAEVKMGETVRMVATVKNRTAQGQPMTLARIGLPGGLTFQTWQLKELREKGLIAQYETGPREVILYFRDLAPSASHEIPIDLVATLPGEYAGPASSAYLYYTDDRKFWADGVKVSVEL